MLDNEVWNETLIEKNVTYSIEINGQFFLIKNVPARAHIWGTLLCPRHTREGCRVRVMSTPRNPEGHARDIRRYVDRCPHS